MTDLERIFRFLLLHPGSTSRQITAGLVPRPGKKPKTERNVRLVLAKGITDRLFVRYKIPHPRHVNVGQWAYAVAVGVVEFNRVNLVPENLTFQKRDGNNSPD